MNLSRLEQETIITFNEEEAFAEVETYNKRLKNRILHIHEERPDECPIKRQSEQAIACQVPKGWIKVIPTLVLTEEQKAKRTERLQKYRQSAKLE